MSVSGMLLHQRRLTIIDFFLHVVHDGVLLGDATGPLVVSIVVHHIAKLLDLDAMFFCEFLELSIAFSKIEPESCIEGTDPDGLLLSCDATFSFFGFGELGFGGVERLGGHRRVALSPGCAVRDRWRSLSGQLDSIRRRV